MRAINEVKCASCHRVITNKTEVEYSEQLSEFFCNFDHAVDYLFNEARCTPFQFEKDEMDGEEVILKNGKLYHKD